MTMTNSSFRKDIEENISFLKTEWENLHWSEAQFCKQLLDWYDRKGYLSDAQVEYLVGYTNTLMKEYE